MSLTRTDAERLNRLHERARRYADNSDNPAIRRVCRAIMAEAKQMRREAEAFADDDQPEVEEILLDA